ncbi:potassium channel family protein [Candidatus Poribacteria bacterium]
MEEEKPQPFTRHGTEEEPTKVSADEILNAIAEGRDVDVRYAEIDGEMNMREVDSQFEGEENGTPIVGGNIAICHSRITGNIYFSGLIFTKSADFRGSSFESAASFSNSVFSGMASFSGCVFSKDTLFIESVFKQVACFTGSIFSEKVNFTASVFGRKTDFGLCSFERGAYFGESSFDRDPKLHLAMLAEAEPVSLDTIGWAYRRSSLFDAGFFFREAAEGYWSEERYSYASDSFRNAKVEYEKEGKYDDAGRMYVKEKESTRLHLKSQSGNRLKRTWLWIWESSSNYGESPLRFIGWIAAIVLIFGLINLPIISTWLDWWPSIEFKEHPFHSWNDGFVDGFLFNIVAAVYYSAVTFATLGFGDITPVNILGRLCAIAEVLLGYLMFGVLITLVARKMTRS